MKNHEKNLVIILLAGGSGKRLSLAIDKQMIKINEITKANILKRFFNKFIEYFLFLLSLL